MSLTTFTRYKVVMTIFTVFNTYILYKNLQFTFIYGEHLIARNATKRWAKNKTKICSAKENNF